MHHLLQQESQQRTLITNDQYDTAVLFWSQVADRTTDKATLFITEQESTARHVLMQSQWTTWVGFIDEAYRGKLEHQQAKGTLAISAFRRDLDRLATENTFELRSAALIQSELEHRLGVRQEHETEYIPIASAWVSWLAWEITHESS